MSIPRQSVLWTQGQVVDEVAQQRCTKRRSKSEKRKRTERVTVRLLPSERLALTTAAHHTGVSLAAFIRTTALQETLPTTTEEVEQTQ